MFWALNGVVAEVLTGPNPSPHDAGDTELVAIELHDEGARAIRFAGGGCRRARPAAIIDDAALAVAEEFSEPC